MKRIILLVLINIWTVDGQLLSMDKPPSKTPLASNLNLISDGLRLRYQLRIHIQEPELKRLIEQAEKGDAKVQYELACAYYYGLTNPTMQSSLKDAEHWFLFARKSGDLRAFLFLIELAQKQNDTQKLINYTYEAIDRGFNDQYYYLGKIYLNQKKYKKAQEAFEKAIQSLKDYQNDHYFKWIIDSAKVEVANIIRKGLSGVKNDKKAISILTELANLDNIHALFSLAMINLEGSENLQRNVERAHYLLSKIEKNGEPKRFEDIYLYHRAIFLLGNLYENDPYNNINLAKEYYNKAYNWDGKYHLARLVISKKINGDIEQAKKILQEGALRENPALLAAYIYGTMMIGEGNQQEGITILEKVDEKSPDNHSLVALQLGIAYSYGFGVEQNEQTAQKYFNKILNDTELSYKSTLLGKGYLYLFGLGGVKKDIAKGLALINESENKLDDVYFETDQLLPAISKLRAEQAAVMQKELIGQEPEKKVKKKKKRAAESTLPVVEEPEDDPFQTTEKEWNEYFAVDDGSYVSLIDKKNKVFIINDPKRDQQLIVKFENLPARDLTDIAALKYHKRILERQGYTKRRLKHTTKYNHDFAEMLDYVIQYLGEYVPFAKDGSDKHDDQIIATVIRKDLKTGKEVINKAEYTFGQKGDEVYVYHRLLRPIKVAMP